MLAYPDFHSKEPFILDTDWSKDPGCIGAVLSQVQDGQERAICYGAYKLSGPATNYSSNKGELLAVIDFMRKWKYYLAYKPFILWTDHSALRWIKMMEMPKGMILRWLETLGNNNFVIQFRDGKDQFNADPLSHCNHAPNRPDNDDPMDEEEDVAQMKAHNNLICTLVYPDELTAGDITQHQE